MNQKYKYGKIVVAAYGGLGLLGTLLLLLPWASTQPGSTSFIEAWVTSISALTVTGLTIVNTGNHWSLFGQAVILILIQVGGLGLIVLTTLLLIILGYRMNLGYRVLVSQEQRQFDFSGVGILFRNIVLLVLTIELLGALFLCLVWPNLWEQGIGQGLFTVFFHAVSAFNGAGFDITGHSLLPYREAIGVNLIIMSLVFLGSLGYVVLLELIGLMQHWHRLTLHSRLVLLVTGVITLVGSGFYLLTEYTAALAGQPWSQKIVESLFQSVTRTAGFVTVSVESWNEPFQFLMIIMMFIGASPGSVGGGIKTTTVGLIVLAGWSIARGQKNLIIGEREIDSESIARAFTVTVLALMLVCLSTLVIMLIENLPPMPVLFEVVSALATVGLSMGITAQMSPLGLAVLSLIMFIGRIGLMSLVFILDKPKEDHIRYLKETVFID